VLSDTTVAAGLDTFTTTGPVGSLRVDVLDSVDRGTFTTTGPVGIVVDRRGGSPPLPALIATGPDGLTRSTGWISCAVLGVLLVEVVVVVVDVVVDDDDVVVLEEIVSRLSEASALDEFGTDWRDVGSRIDCEVHRLMEDPSVPVELAGCDSWELDPDEPLANVGLVAGVLGTEAGRVGEGVLLCASICEVQSVSAIPILRGSRLSGHI